MRKILIVVLVCAMVWPGLVSASTLYRCNGLVQYRPCSQPFSYVEQNAAVPKLRTISYTRKTRVKHNKPAVGKVLTQSYRRISKRQGLWKGRINGKGDIRLRLLIFRNGALESTRYMGNVYLTPTDNSISFNFRSSLPRGSNWSWKVQIARA
ncbi:hypothetical protein OAO01_02360 [Oligoflexia bacterium]|nr:hypothetical protein [Oligoflexia bacterium]